MTLSRNIPTLTTQRDQVRRQLAEIGDLRPGSLVPNYRKCGKPNCHCASEGSRGHGPHWILTHKVQGKTRTRIIPSSEVEKTRAHVAECQRLRRLVGELVEVSEQLCQTRMAQRRSEAREEEDEKKSLRGGFCPGDRSRGRTVDGPGRCRQA